MTYDPVLDAPPPLRSRHRNATSDPTHLSSSTYWLSRSTRQIVDSLAPGQLDPLTVKEDGLVMNGHLRISVLRGRGVRIDTLPRVPYP